MEATHDRDQQHRGDSAGLALGTAERQQDQPADDAGGAKPQRDRARADGRDQEEGGAERADDRAEGRNAIDGARNHARALRRSQHQPDRERRIHSEEGHRKQQDRQRGDEAAGAHVVDIGEQEFEQGLGKRGQDQHVDRGHQHGRPRARSARRCGRRASRRGSTPASGPSARSRSATPRYRCRCRNRG